MTRKKPEPVEYDESIVQHVDYVPTSHADAGGSHRWSGGFFTEGRRNPNPGGSDGEPLLPTVAQYDGLGGLASLHGGTWCSCCRSSLPLSAFSPKPGDSLGRLRSICDACAARSKRNADKKRRKDT